MALAKKNAPVLVAVRRNPEKLKAYILNPDRNLLCVNDVRLSEKKYEALREAMLSAMETRFPSKSRFEK